jgi:hypothetical protein
MKVSHTSFSGVALREPRKAQKLIRKKKLRKEYSAQMWKVRAILVEEIHQLPTGACLR